MDATGGDYAAGIGSGDRLHSMTPTGDRVSISGGRVRAKGGLAAAGVGSSDYGICEAVNIAGGTIMALNSSTLRIGAGSNSRSAVTITGGAVYSTFGDVRPVASNSVPVVVRPVDFDLRLPEAKILDFSVSCGGVEYAYGEKDLYTDRNGILRVWLPDGDYTFTADDDNWVATVAGAPAKAVLSPVGVTVNGTDVGAIAGEGWFYSRKEKILTLESAGPFTLGGAASGVLCKTKVSCEVVADSLSIDNSSVSGRPAFEIATGTTVGFTLAGSSVLKGGAEVAALNVTQDATLTIGGTGALDATGGSKGAGIGGGLNTVAGTVNITNGTVTATGGFQGAGIGSGHRGWIGAIAISGGEINATGGNFAASIGAGDHPDYYIRTCGSILITGGIVRAASSSNSAAIGCGHNGSSGSITVYGGTILTSGSGSKHIGSGVYSKTSSVSIYGGSVAVQSDNIVPAASNALKRVWRVTVPGLEPGAKVDKLAVRVAPEFTLGDYGTDDIFADSEGKVYIWLQDGDYRIGVSQEGHDDLDLAATVSGADAEAAVFVPETKGVTVNGTDVGCNFGEGWSFYNGVVRIEEAGTYEIAGSASGIGVLAKADCAVTLNGLSLDASGVEDRAAFAIAPGASVDLTLAGENVLKSGKDCAGLQVPVGAAVTIGGEGALAATGGQSSAGIGGGFFGSAGTVSITGGTVVANGDANAAGIGSGAGGLNQKLSGGTISISGGTVTANGDIYGAGIGGGFFGSSGEIRISGGVVTAAGGQFGAGIGGGQYGDCVKIVISGGRVSATSESYAAAIGGGCGSASYGGSAGEILITGGTVVAAANGLNNYAPADIGAGNAGGGEGSVVVTGGSVHTLTKGIVSPVASNGTERVGCASFAGFTPGAAVELGVPKLNGAAWNYGVESVYADDDGKVYLWLPEGDNAVFAGGRLWHADVAADGAVAEAVPYETYSPTGVSVDGVDAAHGGEGWEWWPVSNELSIFGDAGVTLSGGNNSAGFHVAVNTAAPVTFDGLVLNANESPVKIGSGVSATVALGAQENVLRVALPAYAALQVPSGSSLTITNAAENGKLSAMGGNDAAGIGGNRNQSVGTIRIAGGDIVARSGSASGDMCSPDASGAGIGSGYKGKCGDIYITGGRVYAYGGRNQAESIFDSDYLGAGIGGGDSSDSEGCRIEISGGTVVAMGGRIESGDKFAADIGDGLGPGSLFSQENGYTVVISGGSVLPRHGGKQQFTQSKADEENTPRNADGAPVHYVPLNVGEGDRKVRFSGLENYGTDDIWSDAYGNVHLWLPSGVQPPTPILMMSAKGGGTPEKPLYDFMANGYRCTVEADANNGLVAKSEEIRERETPGVPVTPDRELRRDARRHVEGGIHDGGRRLRDVHGPAPGRFPGRRAEILQGREVTVFGSPDCNGETSTTVLFSPAFIAGHEWTSAKSSAARIPRPFASSTLYGAFARGRITPNGWTTCTSPILSSPPAMFSRAANSSAIPAFVRRAESLAFGFARLSSSRASRAGSPQKAVPSRSQTRPARVLSRRRVSIAASLRSRFCPAKYHASPTVAPRSMNCASVSHPISPNHVVLT